MTSREDTKAHQALAKITSPLAYAAMSKDNNGEHKLPVTPVRDQSHDRHAKAPVCLMYWLLHRQTVMST